MTDCLYYGARPNLSAGIALHMQRINEVSRSDRSIRLTVLIAIYKWWIWEAAWKSTSLNVSPAWNRFWSLRYVETLPNLFARVRIFAFITAKLVKLERSCRHSKPDQNWWFHRWAFRKSTCMVPPYFDTSLHDAYGKSMLWLFILSWVPLGLSVHCGISGFWLGCASLSCFDVGVSES